MQSLYNYCFYVSANENSHVLWQWRPYLHVDENGRGIKDEHGDYVEDTSRIEGSALKIDDSIGFTSQRLSQAKGEMIDSRVLYQTMGKFSQEGSYTQQYANRLTTYISEVSTIAMQPTQKNSAGESRPVDFYRLEPVIHRFHVFLVMPGDIAESVDDADFKKLSVAVFDER